MKQSIPTVPNLLASFSWFLSVGLIIPVLDLMRSEGSSFCCFHPRHSVVGVCAFCLNERLLLLASSRSPTPPPPRLLRVFRFLHRRLLLRRRTPEPSDHEASTSHQGAFISMKFERNGIGSWERTEPPKASTRQPWKHSSENEWKKKKTKSERVTELQKRHPTLKWRKRMDQLMRWWKHRPNESGGAVCHASSKVGYGV